MKLNSIRGREALKKLLWVLLAIGLVALILGFFTYYYLQRYTVYTEDGPTMDMRSYPVVSSEPVTETVQQYNIQAQIVYDEPLEPLVDPNDLPDLTQLKAVYVGYDQLKDIPALKEQLKEMEYEALVLRVKRDHGNLMVPSTAGSGYVEDGAQAVADFVAEEAEKGTWMVAQICCFRDDLYALAHQSDGLPISGGALWVDNDNYYWMDPSTETAQDYVIALGKELKKLGFSEVLLENFCYPTDGRTSSIVYGGSVNKVSVISQGAENVMSSLEVYGLRVSLVCSVSACKNGGDYDAGVDLAALTGTFDRIYVESSAGSEVKGVADGLDTASNGRIQMKNWLVFITGSNDTRFKEYGLAKVLD